MSLNKRIWSLVLFLYMACGLGAEESNPMVIQSGEAVYNGREISLVGQVVVQHELGQIAARHLTIQPGSDLDKKMKFSLLKMKDDIVIDLKNGGRLCCQQATVDFHQLKGNFLGNEAFPDVIFTNQIEKPTTQASSPFFMIKSSQMEATLAQESETSQSQKKTTSTSIRYLQADGEVRVNYNQDYLVLADHAFYEQKSQEKSALKGVLTLAAAENKVCTVTNQHGDQIKGDSIKIDLPQRQLSCLQPRGLINLSQVNNLISSTAGQVRQPVEFSADKLTWDEANQVLILENHVQVRQNGIGELKTEKEARIYRHEVKGKKEIQSIVFPEETELTYLDEKKKLTHRILCHGPLTIDQQKMQILMQSPKDAQGQVVQSKQVYFEDLMGDIYADEVLISYAQEEKKWVPTRLTMEGHVQIMNRFDGHLQESGSVLQYALADSVDYNPKAKEMSLTGHDKKRVLFFDKVNKLQMSAPALKIKRDQSQKDSIQGIGDVRFTFIENEFEQLKKRFNFNESNP